MISNPEVAEKVSNLMLEYSEGLATSIADVRAACPEEEFLIYRRAVARIMGEMLLTIMNPIYEMHPSLKPSGLR